MPATTPHHAIEAEGLVKRFGGHDALAGLDLQIAAGTVCGMLGPNGAGKTTAVRVLTTLTRATSGTARVAGFDVARDPRQVRARIGVVGQDAAIDEVLGGRQNLVLFARLHGLSARAARRRADELLARFSLEEAAERAVSTFSGGMRRRLDLAVSLLVHPLVLFLDEPTTGLDPRARAEVWDDVRALAAEGTTVLLTTQYLEEADQLATDLALVDHGRVIARGTPDDLKGLVGGDRLDVVLTTPTDLERARTALAPLATAAPEIDETELRLSVPIDDRVRALGRGLSALAAAGVDADDLAVRRPTLDEAFLQLTGRREATAGQEAAA